MIPTNLLGSLTEVAPVASSSPTLTIFATLLGGGMLVAIVAAYKARAERGTVVATGSEKAVLSMERSLAAMEKRAVTAENRADAAEGREIELEHSLEAARVTAEALVVQLEVALVNARTARNKSASP